MTTHTDNQPALRSRDAQWVAALIVGATALRLAYLAVGSPYELAQDEAHYWEWSRRLDWSYVTKGPGVALLIRASTELLGNTEFGVRLWAPIAGGLIAWCAAAMASIASGGDRRAGLYAATLVLLAPIHQLPALLMTIDGPFVACWAGGVVAALFALFKRSRWAWLALGLTIGVGMLFKHTILLLPPGLLLGALLTRRALAMTAHWRRWLAACVIVALLGMAPVIIWNAQNDWQSVRHLLGHLGLPGGDMPATTGGEGWSYDPRYTLEFIAVQFGVVGPALVLTILCAVEIFRRRTPSGAETTPEVNAMARTLLFSSAPLLVFYLLVTIVTRAEGNWAMAAYPALLALAGWRVREVMPSHVRRIREWHALPKGQRPRLGLTRRRPEQPTTMLWNGAVVYGLVSGLIMLRLDWAAMAPGIGKVMPAARLAGAAERAEHASELADRLRDGTGLEPFFVAQHYGRASQLAFYLPGHPNVMCSTSQMGGRLTQYDHWESTNLASPDLTGRPAVLLGGGELMWGRAFNRVETIEGDGRLRGEHKDDRFAFLGYGYLGFEPPETSP